MIPILLKDKNRFGIGSATQMVTGISLWMASKAVSAAPNISTIYHICIYVLTQSYVEHCAGQLGHIHNLRCSVPAPQRVQPFQAGLHSAFSMGHSPTDAWICVPRHPREVGTALAGSWAYRIFLWFRRLPEVFLKLCNQSTGLSRPLFLLQTYLM